MKEEKPTFEHPQPQSNQPEYGQVANTAPDLGTVASDLSALSAKVLQMQNDRINLNTDIIGLFETVTVAPTGVPLGPWSQVKIATIAGTTYLYVYDTASNTWKRVTIA